MIEPPVFADTVFSHAAIIPLNVTRAEMPPAFPAALAELHAVLSAQGIAATGPVFAHHLRQPAGGFEFEACIPVAVPVAPQGRVVAGIMAALPAVRTVYHGDYAGLPGAWGDFKAWLRLNGVPTGPTFWEIYAVGPGDTPDPAAWRTELVYPRA